MLPPDLGSAMFGLAACALHPSKVTFRSPTPIAGHPEAAVLDDADGRRRPVPDRATTGFDLDRPRRHPARGRPARLPRHPGHGPDPVRAGQPRPRTQRARRTSPTCASRSPTASRRCSSCARWARGSSSTATTWTFEGVEQLHGATLSSFNDHRVLMALAVAGSTATGVTELSYPHAYRISYPEFLDHMNALGVPAAVSRRRRVPSGGLRPRHDPRRPGHGTPASGPGERAVVEVGADGRGPRADLGVALKTRRRPGRGGAARRSACSRASRSPSSCPTGSSS